MARALVRVERVDLVSQTANESTGESNSIVLVRVECAGTYSLLETNDVNPLGQPRLERTVPRLNLYARQRYKRGRDGFERPVASQTRS